MTNQLTLIANKKAENATSHKEREYLTHSKDGTLTGSTIIKLGPDGKEIGRSGYDGDGRELFHEEVIYSENHSVREVISHFYDAGGALLQQKLAKFDHQGDLLEMTHLDSHGEVIDRQVYSYSDNGVSYSHFNVAGKLIESWHRTISGRGSQEATV